MTTSTFTSPMDCDTDANFRAWGSQISAQLAAVGLTQTADTGQINWTTASISGYPGIVGYEIWRFNDAAQGTTPIFIKIGYGADGAGSPRMSLIVGNASDGSGTITGTLKTNTLSLTQSISLGNAAPSYLSYDPAAGALGVALKIGLAGSQLGTGWHISRTNDTAGNVTTDGWTVQACNTPGATSSCYSQCLSANFQTATGNWSTSANLCTWPYVLTTSFAGGSIQAQPINALAPEIQVDAKKCCVLVAEVGAGIEFDLNVVGLTAKHFISVGGALGNIFASGGGGYATAMLWQ